MKKIAVLITVFNRKEKSLMCLRNLFSQTLSKDFSLEVYLVDDGCTDGTPEAIKNEFPQVKIIKGSGSLFWNRGMHLAWNEAIKADNYDYFLLINDDTELMDSGVISSLLETSIDKEDKAIIVGTTVSFSDHGRYTYGGRTKKGVLVNPQEEPVLCDSFNGNIVLIPDYVYKKVGTNDPVFHHTLGDFDYGLRATKLGLDVYIAPGVLGKCDTHESLAVWCNPEKPFKKRWKAFRSPLGNNPEEYFVYERRHNGFLMACFHYCTNHLRVVMPSIWSK